MYRIFIVEDDKGISDAIIKETELWDIQCRAAGNFRDIMS